MNKKSILILSTGDFREKGIRVGIETPIGYRDNGREVIYIVARDMSKYSHYIYEDPINIKGIHIERFELPLTNLRNKISNNFLRAIFNKISLLYTSLLLAKRSLKFIKSKKINVIYGYETYGIIAIGILKILGKLKGIKTVSRFLGTWIYNYIQNKKYFKLLLNIDVLISFKIPVDHFIMTNDGTQGDKAIELISKHNYNRLIFLPNGVNKIKADKEDKIKIKKELNIQNDDIIITSISRLEKWKRVDRIIEIVNILVNKEGISKIKYFIIGDGNDINFLKGLVKKYNLEKNIIFVGALKNDDVKKYYNISEYFFSTYDLSNVGNPLLEAIRCNLIIFTLNNGDTNKWIRHGKNGFIYEVNSNLYTKITEDFVNILNNEKLKDTITTNITNTEKKYLFTWPERIQNEIKKIEA